MNVLLTGATGFVGSYILAKLINSGHNVSIIRRKNSNNHRISEFINQVSVFDDVKNIKNSLKFNCIIHCATSYEKGDYAGSEILSSNINLPVYLLDYAIHTNCKKFINISTFIAQYQSTPPNRYALTKRHFEEWGAYYSNHYPLNFVNLALHQVYGVGDSVSKFIPWLVSELKQNVDSIDLTKGDQERDFINVVDVAKAVSLIVDQKNDNVYENYEIRTGRVVKIKFFAELVKKLANSNTKLIFGIKDYRKNEIMTLKVIPSNLNKFGWSPDVELEDGIKQMLNSY